MVSIVELVMSVARLATRTNVLIGAQIDPSEFPRWIFDALVWGYLVLLVLGIIIGLILLIQGRSIRRQADEAGIEAPLPSSSRNLKPFGIDPCYWITAGIILFAILWVTMPIIRASFTETQIGAGAFLILAGVAWFLIPAGIIWLLHEYPRRQRLLDEAIQHKTVKGTKPQTPTHCSACGTSLQKNEQYCSQCGAKTT